MNVKTRPTFTGMLAIAAAGILAAGAVGDRANTLFGSTSEKTPPPAPSSVRLADAGNSTVAEPGLREP